LLGAPDRLHVSCAAEDRKIEPILYVLTTRSGAYGALAVISGCAAQLRAQPEIARARRRSTHRVEARLL